MHWDCLLRTSSDGQLLACSPFHPRAPLMSRQLVRACQGHCWAVERVSSETSDSSFRSCPVLDPWADSSDSRNSSNLSAVMKAEPPIRQPMDPRLASGVRYGTRVGLASFAACSVSSVGHLLYGGGLRVARYYQSNLTLSPRVCPLLRVASLSVSPLSSSDLARRPGRNQLTEAP